MFNIIPTTKIIDDNPYVSVKRAPKASVLITTPCNPNASANIRLKYSKEPPTIPAPVNSIVKPIIVLNVPEMISAKGFFNKTFPIITNSPIKMAGVVKISFIIISKIFSPYKKSIIKRVRYGHTLLKIRLPKCKRFFRSRFGKSFV